MNWVFLANAQQLMFASKNCRNVIVCCNNSRDFFTSTRPWSVGYTLNNIKFHIVAVFSPRRLVFALLRCIYDNLCNNFACTLIFFYRRERPVLSSWTWSLSHDLPAAGKVLSKRRFRSFAKVLQIQAEIQEVLWRSHGWVDPCGVWRRAG